MRHRIKLMKDSKYVRLELVGKLTRRDHETARAEAALAITENGWNKLLIDASLAEPEMSFVDDYYFTGNHKSHFSTDLCTAIVHRPNEIEKFQFIEDVGVNRGMSMKLFTDGRKALDWLLDS